MDNFIVNILTNMCIIRLEVLFSINMLSTLIKLISISHKPGTVYCNTQKILCFHSQAGNITRSIQNYMGIYQTPRLKKKQNYPICKTMKRNSIGSVFLE